VIVAVAVSLAALAFAGCSTPVAGGESSEPEESLTGKWANAESPIFGVFTLYDDGTAEGTVDGGEAISSYFETTKYDQSALEFIEADGGSFELFYELDGDTLRLSDDSDMADVTEFSRY